MLDKSVTPRIVRLQGELNVRTITDAYEHLVSELAMCTSAVIDTHEVSDADLTLVQLIEAARRSASSEGKELALAQPISAALREVLERGGFLNAKEDAVFWLHEARG